MFMHILQRCSIVIVLSIFSPSALMAADPFRIGVLTDMTGPSADAGGKGSVVAAEMAVADFGGSVLGRKIEVLSADHLGKPDVGASIARSWFDKDGVDAIVDVPVSSVALAVQEVATRAHKILLVTSAATTALTGPACSPYTFHWADDAAALARGTARAVVDSGGKSWFLINQDQAFGVALEASVSDVVVSAGGTILGKVRIPMNLADHSSFLLQAQASKAQVIEIGSVGTDLSTELKQAQEFQITQSGQRLAGLLVFITDIHGLGLEISQGLQITSSFYWDQNEEARAFARRFYEIHRAMPTKIQAAGYASITHYLGAVKAVETSDATKVAQWMKEHPAGYFGKKAIAREDGRMMFDVALWEVKKPSESKYPWDYYKRVSVLPADRAFLSLEEGGCPLVKR
jgi:branched-chain amino acid transport system substrate-binding protein